MPNTLVHLGVQGLTWRGLGGKPAELNWVFLGAVIPDVPWIIRHGLNNLAPGLDAYDLVCYATVQASLLFCLLLAAGLSVFCARPRLVFGVLAFNAVFHLIIDATEIKWGNGVHFIAPLSWQLTTWGQVWPESAVVGVLTLMGLAVALWALAPTGPGPMRLCWPRAGLLLPAAVAIAAYLVMPLTLTSGPYEADNHSVKTLREQASRTGKAITFDRKAFYELDGRPTVRTYAGEEIAVVDSPSTAPGVVSIRGRFVDPNTVAVDDIHYHRVGFRDGASYLGLLLFAALWLAAGRPTARQPSP